MPDFSNQSMPPASDNNPASRPGGNSAGPPQHQPPRFFRRLGLLLLRPEQWAESAMFPYRYVLGPLLFIILVVSVPLAAHVAGELVNVEEAAVGQYDQSFKPMLLSHGTLKILPAPGKKILLLNQPDYELRVDITGRKTAADLHQPMGLLVTNDKLYTKVFSATQTLPLSRVQRYFLLAAGNTAVLHVPVNKLPDVTVNSKSLRLLLRYLRPALVLAIGLILFGFNVVKFLGWALIMTVLISPGVMILNQHLAMPLRVAMRIGTAVMIPLVVVRGLLEYFRHSSLMPSPGHSGDFYAMVWWLAPLPLGLWAGFLASRNLTRTSPGRR